MPSSFIPDNQQANYPIFDPSVKNCGYPSDDGICEDYIMDGDEICEDDFPEDDVDETDKNK